MTYFQINDVLKETFDVKLLMYQQLYDVRTWPLDLLRKKNFGKELFPIFLEKKEMDNVYSTEFEETIDAKNHVVVTFGRMTGRTSVNDEEKKKIIPVYFIFEATLYQGCCEDMIIICDRHTVQAQGKIFLTPNLKVFNYCYNNEWDNDNNNDDVIKDLKSLNLCKFLVNSQINSGKKSRKMLQQTPIFFREDINLRMAKKEYDKSCPITQCCAKERRIITHH